MLKELMQRTYGQMIRPALHFVYTEAHSFGLSASGWYFSIYTWVVYPGRTHDRQHTLL